MKRLAQLAAGLAIAAGVVLFGAGTSGATVGDASSDGVSALSSCSGTYSFGGAHVTVRCTADSPGSEFRAIAYCPNGDVHLGPWVPQGGDHVSVATCANPMITWDRDLR